MCVVSMIYDHYNDKWKDYLPKPEYIPPTYVPTPSPISPEEIAEFRRLLERAKEYDKRNNEPDCEDTQKKELLKRLASLLGVEIELPE